MPSLLYASAGVNRSSHVLDSGIVSLKQGESSSSSVVPIIAYASHKSVVFWEDPQDSDSPGITSYVHVAKAPITALRFITQPAWEEASIDLPYAATISALAVGSADGAVHLLKPSRSSSTSRHKRGARLTWEKCLTLPAKHAGSISTIAVIKHAPGSSKSSQEEFVIATGGSDGKLRIWWLFSQSDSIEISGEPFEMDLGGPFPLERADACSLRWESRSDALPSMCKTARTADSSKLSCLKGTKTGYGRLTFAQALRMGISCLQVHRKTAARDYGGSSGNSKRASPHPATRSKKTLSRHSLRNWKTIA